MEVALPQDFLSLLPRPNCSAPTKLLQTQRQWGFMVSKQNSGGIDKYAMIFGRTICGVQSLLHNTPGCLLSALRESDPTCLPDLAFQSCTRLVACDRHPSNLVVERRERRRLYRKMRTWLSLVVPCRQHMMQSIRVSATSNFEDVISGMINISLRLITPGALSIFRGLLEDHLRRRLDVQVGRNPLEAEVRRQLILKWFVPHVGDHWMARMLLSALATGDWGVGVDEKIYIMVPAGVAFDKEVLIQKAVVGISSALASRAPMVYLRKKWMHAEEATCGISLMLLLGGCLTPVYDAFCRKMRGARGPT
eukprot:9473768-Pyramimonas_sp.AAC.1